MGVVEEAGYTWTDGTHARILHANNRFRVKTVSAGTEPDATNYPKEAANNGLTYEKYRPHTNQVTDPTDLSTGNWTATRFSVGADGKTLDEGTDVSNTRFMNQAFTFTAVEWVVAVKVERQTMDGLRVQANDGTSDFYADVDLTDGTIDFSSGGTWAVKDLGDDVFEVSGYFTPLAATGFIRILGWDAAASDITYTGTNRTVKVLQVTAHLSSSNLRYDLFSAQSGDVMCIAAHNFGSSGTRVRFQHDSNEDDTWTTIGTHEPSDDMPIMFFFDAVSSSRWRIVIDRGVIPEVGVFQVGSPLKVERPIYGSYVPPRYARKTELRSSYSETGEFIGRTKQRTYTESPLSWRLLSRSWLDSNWYEAMKAVETEPFFVAPLPAARTDCLFGQTTQSADPIEETASGFAAVNLNIRGLGYD